MKQLQASTAMIRAGVAALEECCLGDDKEAIVAKVFGAMILAKARHPGHVKGSIKELFDSGLKSRQIAEALNLSGATVRTHLMRMGLKCREKEKAA